MKRRAWVVEQLSGGRWVPAGTDAAFVSRDDALAAKDRWSCGPCAPKYRVVSYVPRERVKR